MIKITKNDFTLKSVLKEMVVLELGKETISMNEIINYVHAHRLQPFTLSFQNSNKQIFILNCYKISKNYFSFEIGQTKGEDIFTNPIIYFDQNNKLWELISLEQIYYFLNSFKNPMIKCKINGILYSPSYYHIKSHLIHEDKIVDTLTYEIYDKNSFSKFFETHPNNFLNETFKSPIEFDKNFNYYFNYNKKNKTIGSFHIYDNINDTRFIISRDFLDLYKPSPYYYCGVSGKGKSITLIGSLKYRDNFFELGSFYINCKCLKKLLFDGKGLYVKQILIDEIIYLNPNSYSIYEKSVNYIESFSFEDNYSYLKLIDNLLEKFICEDFKYLIAFDQYDESQDPDKILGKILKKYEIKNNIHFIIISSIDEINIRKIKLQYLLGEILLDKARFCEINEICKIEDNSLNYEQQEALDKLGNTFKALNEIKNNTNIKKYLTEQKFKYSKKIIKFYLSNKFEINKYIDNENQIILKIPLDIIGKIISFKTDYIYDKSNIISIKDYIPFRFYDIEGINNNKYIIKFGFPLIKEILLDIYSHITLNNNYNALKTILNNKGSNLGTIFELKIIFNLSEGKKLFDFTIKKKFVIHTIVPKSNENINLNIDINKKINSKIRFNLEDNTTYVVHQEIFNGKALDFLIIRVINKEVFIYGFQISIYKDEIFDENYLIDDYRDMIENLDLIFSTKINYYNTFFGYIFDYSRIKEKDYEKMLKKCNNRWPYCFYDTEENIFCDENHIQITDINSVVVCPLFKKERIYSTIKNQLFNNLH